MKATQPALVAMFLVLSAGPSPPGLAADGVTLDTVLGRRPAMQFDFDSQAYSRYAAFLHHGVGAYAPEIGFGWQTATSAEVVEHGVGDRLARDGVRLSDGTFAVSLFDGDFEVSVIMGDLLEARDQVQLSLEGQIVDTVTTAAGELHQASYVVSVSGGQLELGLTDLGGANSWAQINALTITPVDTPDSGLIEGVAVDDANGNGVFDEGETTLAGWPVFLDANANGVLDTDEVSTATNASGHYAFTGLSSGSHRVVLQAQTGWQQTAPASGPTQLVTLGQGQLYSLSFAGQLVGGPLPTVSIAAADATATETIDGSDPAEFVITRTGATTDPLTVYFAVDGSAAPSFDHDLPSLGQATIEAGRSTVTVSLTPMDDFDEEGSETVLLTLAAGSQYSSAPLDWQAAADLEDNDDFTLPVVSVSASDPAADEAGADPGEFLISLKSPATEPLTVYYQLAGSATDELDYGLLSGEATISEGEDSVTVTVVPVDDSEREGNEEVLLLLDAAPEYYTDEAAEKAAVTIRDNEPPRTEVDPPGQPCPQIPAP